MPINDVRCICKYQIAPIRLFNMLLQPTLIDCIIRTAYWEYNIKITLNNTIVWLNYEDTDLLNVTKNLRHPRAITKLLPQLK